MSAMKRNLETTKERKGLSQRAKVMAGVLAGTALLSVGCAAEEKPLPTPNFPSISGEANPGQLSHEFIERQQRVDAALPYLRQKNEENRKHFENELDKVSSLKGANYFKGRGEKFEATATMEPDEALSWIQLQIFKADEAAKVGDTTAAYAIADAVTEGRDHTEVVEGFATNISSVNAAIVTDQAPHFAVENSGSITAKGETFFINEPGSKLYAYTAVTTETAEPFQQVIRFTPSSNSEEGAWAVVASVDPGTITFTDVSTNQPVTP